MAELFSPEVAPSWILQRIVNFFNKAASAQEIHDTILDDPNFSTSDAPESKAVAIGMTVAQRILDHRNGLPGKRFRSISDLNAVKGLGEDKFRDLIYTFNKCADDSFVERMYDGVIHRENFTLENRHIQFFDEETFKMVIDCDDRFTNHVGEILENWVEEKHSSRKLALLSRDYLKQLWLEKTESADVASYYFAYWFYRFDADNWFSFDRVRQETAHYLEYNTQSQDRIELRFFKGFNNGILIADAITVEDLPVVINHGERKITIWAGSLFD